MKDKGSEIEKEIEPIQESVLSWPPVNTTNCIGCVGIAGPYCMEPCKQHLRNVSLGEKRGGIYHLLPYPTGPRFTLQR